MTKSSEAARRGVSFFLSSLFRPVLFPLQTDQTHQEGKATVELYNHAY